MLLNMGNNFGKSSLLQGNIQFECILCLIRVNVVYYIFLMNMFWVVLGDVGNLLLDVYVQELREV